MRRGIRFMLGEEVRTLPDPPPTMTVLDYLRRVERRMGTKEGCAEGDCGACTVVIAEPGAGPDGAPDAAPAWQAVCACIRLLPTLDGCRVLTIEDLAKPGAPLHPIQDAMVRHHASQCGFCTPGIVMAVQAMALNGVPAERQAVLDGLAGNLCRCTGYGPIVDAALDALASPATAAGSNEPWPTVWAEDRGFSIGPVGPTEAGGFHAPANADALAATLLAHPGATILAGGTDVGLWVTKQDRALGTIIWLGRAADLATVTETAEVITLGAAVTYAQALPRLAALWPSLGVLMGRIGGQQIRAMGTVGGNVANGSPVGDMPAPLIALGATLVLRRGGERRRLPLEAFFLAYGRQDRRPDEFVEAILIPKPAPGDRFHCAKVSKRAEQDISAVCGAFGLRLEAGRVVRARIAFGGMAGTPARAPAAEAALLGEAWSAATVECAALALEGDYRPISDMRAGAAYRLRAAQNLVRRLWLPDAATALAQARPVLAATALSSPVPLSV